MEFERNMTSKEIQLEVLSLNLLINRQSEIYKLLAKENHIVFKTIISDKQFFFQLNQPLFIEAMDNLFSIALQAAGERGQIQIGLSANGGNATILLSYSGTKPSVESQNNTLSRHSENKIQSDNSGRELKFYVAEKIIKLHKGKIWSDSSTEGTTFYIELNKGIIL